MCIAFCLASCVGVVTWFGWESIPATSDLVAEVSESSIRQERLVAVNALVVRGYFDEMSPDEFDAWLNERPADVRDFIFHMHKEVVRRIGQESRVAAE